VDGFVLIKGFPQQFSKQYKKATELKTKKACLVHAGQTKVTK